MYRQSHFDADDCVPNVGVSDAMCVLGLQSFGLMLMCCFFGVEFGFALNNNTEDHHEDEEQCCDNADKEEITDSTALLNEAFNRHILLQRFRDWFLAVLQVEVLQERTGAEHQKKRLDDK